MGWAILSLLIKHAKKARAGNPIVGTFPFPLDLDAVLRCRMAEAEVDAWKRAVSHDVRQYVHVHARLLVDRRVGLRVGVTAGETIDGALRGIHRHVQLV